MEFRWVAGITIWTMLAGPACVGLNHWHTRAPARAAHMSDYNSRSPEYALTSKPSWLNTTARSATSVGVVASPVSNMGEESDE